MSSPAWQLEEAKPDWWLEPREPRWHLESRELRVEQATIYRTTVAAPELLERTAGEGTATLDVKFAIFDKWTEIKSPEGNFMERILPGAFRKTVSENLASIRAVVSHGKDPSLGMTVLGKIESIREEATGAIARVGLFPSVPSLLVDGLRAGVYGASFRGDSIKTQVIHRPPKSAHNPRGLPEVTHSEIRLKDVGPTTFPAYGETSSRIGGME